MLKVISVLMIFSAFCVICVKYSVYYNNRLSFTSGCIDMFESIKNDITFCSPYYIKALEKSIFYAKGAKDAVLKCIALIKENVSMYEAFEKSFGDDVSCSGKTLEIVLEYVKEAGMSDTETEISKINSVINRLKKERDTQEEFLNTKVANNRKVIMLIGTTVCVFLI